MYQIAFPTPELHQVVKYFWCLENQDKESGTYLHRIVPSGLPEMIFYFGNRPESLNHDLDIQDDFIITGQLKSFYDIKINPPMSLLSVVIEPFGLASLFGVSAHDFLNRNISLALLDPAGTNQLKEALYGTHDFHQKVRMIQKYLTKQLIRNIDQYLLDRIRRSLSLINQREGKLNVELLASETYISRKQLERNMNFFIGTTPSHFLRIVRFQNAIHRRSLTGKSNLTQLAYDTGYFDQSHMINDFTKLSGLTPKAFFNKGTPVSDYFY